MGYQALNELQTVIDALRDRVIKISLEFEGIENAESSLEVLDRLLAVIENIALGITALQTVIDDFPDVSGIFDGVDYETANTQFVNVTTSIIALHSNLNVLNTNLETFDTVFKEFQKGMREFDSAGLSKTVQVLTESFAQTQDSLIPLLAIFSNLAAAIDQIITTMQSSEEPLSTFATGLSNTQEAVEDYSGVIASLKTDLQNIMGTLSESTIKATEFATAISESTTKATEFATAILESPQYLEAFKESANGLTETLVEANPHLSLAAVNFNNMLLPLNAIESNKMISGVASQIGTLSEKIRDTSSYMDNLVEKLRKMSEHTGKLKENLEALTSKTWTINVVYNETKQ